MDKRSLTERDIGTKFILPAVKRFGWDEMVQVREEVYFTRGRIIVRGKLVTRGKAKKADFVLYFKPNILRSLQEKPTPSRYRRGPLQVCHRQLASTSRWPKHRQNPRYSENAALAALRMMRGYTSNCRNNRSPSLRWHEAGAALWSAQ